ncbi:sugar phosphate isomerase/epimerase family protein [Thalassotalea agariperforans]
MKKIFSLLFIIVNLTLLSACNDATETNTSTTTKVTGEKMTVPPLSVQLWSVKNTLKNDFEGTLKALADMGFQGVEFAGDYGSYSDDPKGLKAFLNSIGLQASGAHVGVEQLRGDKLDKTLAFLKDLGTDLVIIPYDSRAMSADGIEEFVVEMNLLAANVKKQNMTLGYHNHDKEFDPYHDATFWDYLAKNTPKDMLLQLDVGWVNYADKDPIEYVKRYEGRTLTTHYKIRTHEGSNDSPILGEDNYDWAALIKTNVEFGGTRWLVIEQEEYPEGLTPMQAVEKSKKGLEKFIQQL